MTANLFLPRAMRRQNEGSNNQVALILLGHTFLTPAVQAIGFDYYNDHGVMSYGKGYWGDKKIIAQFPKMNRADLRLVTNISGERELVEGYIPTDEISIKNHRHWYQVIGANVGDYFWGNIAPQ